MTGRCGCLGDARGGGSRGPPPLACRVSQQPCGASPSAGSAGGARSWSRRGRGGLSWRRGPLASFLWPHTRDSWGASSKIGLMVLARARMCSRNRRSPRKHERYVGISVPTNGNPLMRSATHDMMTAPERGRTSIDRDAGLQQWWGAVILAFTDGPFVARTRKILGTLSSTRTADKPL
jgi:hypothetical protein